MTLRTLTSALLAAAALSAAATGAHAASHDRDTFIKEQDLNGDGKVSKDEFAKSRDAEFARMDANHDGALSHDEYVNDFKARLETMLAATPADKRDEEKVRELRQVEVRFGVLDSDKSGAITPAEFAYSGWRMFIHHDSNNDGVVSKDDPIAKDGG
jgi:Ca2+-binding EF-hand superfamily protein